MGLSRFLLNMGLLLVVSLVNPTGTPDLTVVQRRTGTR